MPTASDTDRFWSVPADELAGRLGSSGAGLSAERASELLRERGPNVLERGKRAGTLMLLLGQFKSPIILLLVFAAVLSLFLHDTTNAIIILVIVTLSGLLGFWQEKGAADAVKRLLAIVKVTASVLRDGAQVNVPTEEIVPGDVVALGAGDIIPADCVVLESNDLFVDEAALTGETYPVEKAPGTLPAEAPLAKRTNSLFMGTHVVSGSGKALVARTGRGTEFGKVSERLAVKPEETEFERGVKRFGFLLMEVTLVLVVAIFAANVYFHKPVLDSFEFSLALAVGLTPQLLPAIISINLAKGAKRMADSKVIVKRLAAIENFGSMDVLCSDKTGTLTRGVVRVDSGTGVEGKSSERVMRYAFLNSYFEASFTDPIDDAVRALEGLSADGCEKLGEIPYDFVRKRLSVLASKEGGRVLITKGAMEQVLAVCSRAEVGGEVVDMGAARGRIDARYHELSEKGYRTLGVACREDFVGEAVSADDEAGMTFLGILALSDPPKEDVADVIERLRALGVSLKVITGDNRLVAANVARAVGLPCERALTGPELLEMSDAALGKRVEDTCVFAEVEPNQKERIIHALRKKGDVVGFMGDGINDASALHAADVGISVDGAVDVAKEAADFVLLEKDLAVLESGVREGRLTFANTMKYVFMATSANFGNMFSMAGASLFLKFLPLLPSQVLLTNLCTDFPEMTIATDRVDPEMVEKPRRWDIGFIRRFMVTFGLLSSVFDYLTFAVLLWVLHSSPELFRTGWFIESVISASMIVLVIRTRRPFMKSRPSAYLFWATVLVGVFTIAVPYTPLGELFGFKPLPAVFYPYLAGILVLYILSAELVKRLFYRWVKD